MIVPMKHVTLLCRSEERQDALNGLAELGVLHAMERDGVQDIPDVKTRIEALSRARMALDRLDALVQERELSDTETIPPADSVEINALVEAIGSLDQRQKKLDGLRQDLLTWEPFGAFDPASVQGIENAGVPVRLFRCDERHLPEPQNGTAVVRLRTDTGQVWGALFGQSELPEGCTAIPLPEQPIETLEQERRQVEAAITRILRFLYAAHAHREALQRTVQQQEEECRILRALFSMRDNDAVAWITGFCPTDRLSDLRARARQAGWGLVCRAPRADEGVPTLVKRPRWLKPIQAVFDVLGIQPGYREVDISAVFLVFFTVFFALLIGDAGYGLIILAATSLARRKLPRAPVYPFALLRILGVGTLAWGALTGNWFGIDPSLLPTWLQPRWPATELNAEMKREAMMRLCFTIGAIHLTVAHTWNALQRWPSPKILAQLGWIILVWCMYFTACGMVLTQAGFPRILPYGFATGILLVVLFMTSREEMRTQWIDHAMLPLSLAGCLVDVISYIRLYAVGVATLQVAESFNTMALGIDIPAPALLRIPLRFVLVALILALGHGLNMMLGALGILVHAVRLNTLEFSQHKGLEWAGFAFRPLQKQNQDTTNRTSPS